MKELKGCLDNKTFLPAQQNLLKIQDRLNILTSARHHLGLGWDVQFLPYTVMWKRKFSKDYMLSCYKLGTALVSL